MKINSYNLLLSAILIAACSAIIYLLKMNRIRVSSNNGNYIAAVAGKSGGHIIPCISIFQEEHEKPENKNKLIFFSTDSELDKKIITKSDQVFLHIPLKLDNFPRYKIWKYPAFIYYFFKSILTSLKTLYIYKPKKIISSGGYISMPVLLSAYILNIPIEIFELNAIPGQATSLMSKLASKVYVCFETAKSYFNNSNVTFKEYPLRYKSNIISKEEARKKLNLNNEIPVLLIIGGSQGSQFINNIARDFIKYLNDLKIKTDIQIIHQTGSSPEAKSLKEFYSNNNANALVFDYINSLEPYYKAATACITRAGSGSLHELKFFNTKAIIIPLETKITDHQIDNGKEWVKRYPNLYKLAIQKDILYYPERFFEKILDIIK